MSVEGEDDSVMGGKPSKGTKRDKRLKENKPRPRRRRRRWPWQR